MNNKPILSIIVPVYNVEQYLPRCLDSILAQTFTDFEVIAVDDGSPDNCGQILDEYAQKDNRIKVIHKENGGVSSARNVALDVAQGEYIGFVDPDDYISCDMYEHLYNEAVAGNYDVVQCNYELVGFAGASTRILDHIQDCVYTKETSMDAFFDNIIRYNVWNKIFRAELVSENRFSEELSIAEDKLFIFEILQKANRIKVTKQYCYYYVKSNTSVYNSDISEKRFDDLKVLDIISESNSCIYNCESFFNHCAIVYLNILFRILGSQKYLEKLPELIKRVQYVKRAILKGNFSKKEKMFTFMLSITPKTTCRLTSIYLNRKK